jgi:hypothetical protein
MIPLDANGWCDQFAGLERAMEKSAKIVVG